MVFFFAAHTTGQGVTSASNLRDTMKALLLVPIMFASMSCEALRNTFRDPEFQQAMARVAAEAAAQAAAAYLTGPGRK